MNMIRNVALFLLTLVACPLFAADTKDAKKAENFQFVGRHLMAQYYDCDPAALQNVKMVSQKMHEAVKASGAQLLDESEYVFQPNGLTMVLLLSESHASIHTYPEYNACFVDLFTCGHNCSAEKFDAVLREYLKPKQVESDIVTRGK
jgi:S-adenosylmethionine decarboxylase